MSSFTGGSENKNLTAWAASALTGRWFLSFKDNEHEWSIHTTKYNFRNDPVSSSTPAPLLRLKWIIKKLSCDLNKVRQWRRRTGNDDLQAVNSLCGPRGACVHTRSCSQTGESCKNKSKLIVMHFPSAKKFNYDGCDRAIQGSRLHYWLVPLRLKCTAPEKISKDGDVNDHHGLYPHFCF